MMFDQVALVARNPLAQNRALSLAEFPVRDVVTAVGIDNKGQPIRNVAELAFNYTLLPSSMEFEVLRYVEGWAWHQLVGGRETDLSHFGIHVKTAEDVNYFRSRGRLMQEVVTVNHTNPGCAERRYHYTILDCYAQMGCALKIIRRLTLQEAKDFRI